MSDLLPRVRLRSHAQFEYSWLSLGQERCSDNGETHSCANSEATHVAPHSSTSGHPLSGKLLGAESVQGVQDGPEVDAGVVLVVVVLLAPLDGAVAVVVVVVVDPAG